MRSVWQLSDLSQKRLTFLEVVDKLKSLLLSHLPEKRRMGVLILSEILTLLDSDCLNSQELPVISAYFCEKLKDHHEVCACCFYLFLKLFLGFEKLCIIKLLIQINFDCVLHKLEILKLIYESHKLQSEFLLTWYLSSFKLNITLTLTFFCMICQCNI